MYSRKKKSASKTCCSYHSIVTSFKSLSKIKLGGSSTQIQEFILEKLVNYFGKQREGNVNLSVKL
jgi:hypothetical protein